MSRTPRAIGFLIVCGVSLLVGCSPGSAADEDLVEGAPEPTAVVSEQPGPEPVVPDATIKDPVGPCRETDTTVYPPSDNEELCTYRRMVVGHTLPREGTTYLSRIVPELGVGSIVDMDERLWRVSEITSIPKESLPDEMYTEEGEERYLVTCDPDSGYTLWADGIMHTRNNLIVTLVEA